MVQEGIYTHGKASKVNSLVTASKEQTDLLPTDLFLTLKKNLPDDFNPARS